MKALLGLQDCDTRITDIQNKKREGPLKIQELDKDLIVIEGKIEEALDQLESGKRESRSIEQDIDELERKIDKSNIKLSNIKSNKEYSAALKEISDLKAQKSAFEDKVIELMEDIEALEQGLVANREEKERLTEKIKKERHELLKELEALERALNSFESERARFSQHIDENLLRMYDSIRRHKGGLAVSSVIEGVCQTCHMGIPPQKFNELIRGDELMSCPNCQRIIYWGGDTRFQIAVEQDEESVSGQ